MPKVDLCDLQVEDYREMFDLTSEDLQTAILEYGFNHGGAGLGSHGELKKAGPQVVSMDPTIKYPLPFNDFSFDFALSAQYLFTKMDEQDVNFHLNTLRELARVAKDVRVFPLTDSHGEPSPLLGPVLLALNQEGYGVEVRNVNYQWHPKANAMLRLWARQCQLP